MVSAEKYWNTWDRSSFARMKHLASGLCIVPGAFSEAENHYTQFPMDENMRLLEHDQDGRYCRFRAVHTCAEWEVEYYKPDRETVLLRMTNRKPPREWGLRYHILVSMGFETAEGTVQTDGEHLNACCGDYCAAAAFPEEKEPYLIEITSDAGAVGHSMEDKGFKSTDEIQQGTNWATCRFVLEQSPVVCMAVSLAHDPAAAERRAQEAAALFDRWEELCREALCHRTESADQRHPHMAEAVCDMMGWNDMYAPELGWAYTSISKHWNGEFGGWYLFFSDACYQVIMKTFAGDLEMASRNLDYALWAATASGNFAGMLCGYQNWVDRTQPPVLGFAVWNYYQSSGDRSALQRAYPVLRRAQQWYFAHRCTRGNGLIQLGTDKTGRGDYRGTKVGAKNEAAMDNSPMYDEAIFDRASGTLQMYDVGITALLALDIQCTAAMAETLGKAEEADQLRQQAEEMCREMNETLWNPEEGMYQNRHFSGAFGTASPTSFYPLAAGAAEGERLERSIGHIFDPEEFFTACPLIAIDARHPAARENSYWRGRTWAPQSFWTYLGLRRCGREQEANRLADAAVTYFEKSWTESRFAYENYNPFTGEGNDSVDSQSFYSWTALLPTMWSMEQFGVDPWNGLCFGFHDGRPFCQKNRSYQGQYHTACADEHGTTLIRSGETIFTSDLPARFRHFTCEAHYSAVTVTAPRTGWVRFDGQTPRLVLVDGVPQEGSNQVTLTEGTHTVELFC